MPERPPKPTSEEIAQYRREMEANRCTFQKVEVLPHNIGYIKLNSFPDPSVCRAKSASAMASLNNANAIIFDLRDNSSGLGTSIPLLATYLLYLTTNLHDI